MRMTITKALIALAVLFTGSAKAQSALVSFTATIPFDFYVGDMALPAGEYTSYSTGPNLVAVRAVKAPWRGALAFFYCTSKNIGSESATNHLVFNQYSKDRIFLSQFWRAGSTDGARLPKSRREREAVTSLLITGNRPATVTVLAKVR